MKKYIIPERDWRDPAICIIPFFVVEESKLSIDAFNLYIHMFQNTDANGIYEVDWEMLCIEEWTKERVNKLFTELLKFRFIESYTENPLMFRFPYREEDIQNVCPDCLKKDILPNSN